MCEQAENPRIPSEALGYPAASLVLPALEPVAGRQEGTVVREEGRGERWGYVAPVALVQVGGRRVRA